MLDTETCFFRPDSRAHIDENLIRDFIDFGGVFDEIYHQLISDELRHRVLNAFVVYRFLCLILIRCNR